jgi:hypothetical protein
VTSRPDQDIYLDAIALLEACNRDDEEGFNTVLAAADGCPWYLTRLVQALADLAGLALEKFPEDAVAGFLGEVRRYVLERQ